MVWEMRKARAQRDGGSIDWLLMRNRLAHLDARNKRALAAALDELEGEDRADLAPRVDELRALRAGVTSEAPDEAVVRYALERLEAALRARTAVGFTRTT